MIAGEPDPCNLREEGAHDRFAVEIENKGTGLQYANSCASPSVVFHDMTGRRFLKFASPHPERHVPDIKVFCGCKKHLVKLLVFYGKLIQLSPFSSFKLRPR